MAVGRKNFIFFHCPLDGVRFSVQKVPFFYIYYEKCVKGVLSPNNCIKPA